MTADPVRDPWLAVPCPVCKAPTGTVCRSPLGVLPEVHGRRREVANELRELIESPEEYERRPIGEGAT